MPQTKWTIAGAVLGAALAASTCVAQEPNKPATDVGKKVDSTVESLKKRAAEASEAIREQYDRARAAVHNMGVSARVYGRLHWDKALNAYRIDVDVKQDGVATITGTVGDAAARLRAVDLTRETVGVVSVVDRLVVAPTTPAARPVTRP